MTSMMNFIKYLRNKPTLQKREDRILPNSFYEADITMIPKTDKDIRRKKPQANVPYVHIHKNLSPNKKMNVNLCLTVYTKSNSQWIINLNVEAKIIKLLEENRRKSS